MVTKRRRKLSMESYHKRDLFIHPSRLGASFWLPPLTIAFTQASIGSAFKDGRMVLQTVLQIITHSSAIDDIPHVRVVWWPEEGQFYSVDNRRLCAYRLVALYAPSMLRRMKAKAVSADDPEAYFHKKMETECKGRQAKVRIGKNPKKWPTVGASLSETHWPDACTVIAKKLSRH